MSQSAAPTDARTCPRLSARRAAWHRARHQILDGGRIFPDPLAVPILGPESLNAPDSPEEAAARGFIATRAKTAEDALSRAVEGGTRQLVVLHAGLETIGLRNPHGASGLRVFEVDTPEILEFKRGRIAAAGIETPGNLAFVPVDLDRDGLLPRLEAAGFNPLRPVFFFCLGLIPAVTYEMGDALLRFISALPRGEVVYDYGAIDAVPEVTAYTERRMEDLLELTNFRWFDDRGVERIRARLVHARA